MMPRTDPGTAPVALSATPAGDRSGAEVDGGQRRVKRGLERASSARHLLGEPERPDRLWHHLPLIGGVGKSVQHHRHQHQHQHGHLGAAPALPLHLSRTEGAGESPSRQTSRTRTVAVVLQEDAEADAAEQMLEAYVARSRPLPLPPPPLRVLLACPTSVCRCGPRGHRVSLPCCHFNLPPLSPPPSLPTRPRHHPRTAATLPRWRRPFDPWATCRMRSATWSMSRPWR